MTNTTAIKMSAVILVSLFLTPFFVFAQFDLESSIQAELEAGGINVNGDEVELRSGDSSISTGNAGTQIQTPDTSINTNNTGTRIETPNARIETNTETRTNTGVGASATNTNIRLDSEGEASLSIRLQEGSVSTNERISLRSNGDAELLIQDDADVDAFVSIASNRDGVSNVSVSNNEVSVSYIDRGRLFGIFPLSYQTRVIVDANNTVTIERPWYGFLVFGTKRSTIENAIVSETSSLSITTSPVEKAQTVDIMTDAVSMHVGNSVSLEAEGASINVREDGSVDMRIE